MQLLTLQQFQDEITHPGNPTGFCQHNCNGFFFFFPWDRIPAKTSPEKPCRDYTLAVCLGCSSGTQETKVHISALLKSAVSNLNPSPSKKSPQSWPCWLPKDPSVLLSSSVRAQRRVSSISRRFEQQPFGWGAKFCLLVSRNTCWGPKESFLTRILLQLMCPHCKMHSFLKVGGYSHKHTYILFPWRTCDGLLWAQERPNDLRVIRCQLQILFHILS